ncbi:MAG: riboflavin synthase, partial [Clostridia bacterium]|nr:riboflavin synthase [Clostridia bacterium]
MFTGIIEEIGTIADVKKGTKSSSVTVNANVIFDDLKIGDSVAVNGMCTTVVTINDKNFTVDIMAESIRKTSLGSLKKGDRVNLERAMSPLSRFGGHIVSGHVDGTGTIYALEREDNAIWVTIGTS